MDIQIYFIFNFLEGNLVLCVKGRGLNKSSLFKMTRKILKGKTYMNNPIIKGKMDGKERRRKLRRKETRLIYFSLL